MRKWIKKIGRSALVQWMIALLLSAYTLMVWCTCRKVHVGQRIRKQKIIALWHGRLAMATFIDRSHGPLYTFSSSHPDSLIVTKAARLHGVKAVYGSTREGALSGFRQALRAAARGASLLFTPDGPTGPRMHAQAGVAELARMTGLPVVPVSFSAQKCWRINSWDKAMIPQPFTTLVLVHGQPLHLAKTTNAPGVAHFSDVLTCQLIEAQNQADKLAGHAPTLQATPEEVLQHKNRNAWKKRKTEVKV